MRIQVKGRGGASADDELLSRVEKKLGKVARQVSPLAELTIELREERIGHRWIRRSRRGRCTSRE